MSDPRNPDAREVDRLALVVTPADTIAPDDFLARCAPLSTWRVRIRTAEVGALVASRAPLGSLDERLGTSVSIRLDRPVPVEPGLNVQILDPETSEVLAIGIVRPWPES